MLEIILLFVLGRNIASIARKKNRNPVGYVLLLVFGWFGLGIGLGFVAAVVGVAGGMNEDDAMMPFLGGYLVGAASATGLAYLVVGTVARLPRRREFDEHEGYDDYDDRPRRRRRDEDAYDYEDDRPRRRRYEDDEDDYDRPRRRRDDY